MVFLFLAREMETQNGDETVAVCLDKDHFHRKAARA